MNRILVVIATVLVLNAACSDNKMLKVSGVSEPVISLNGRWKIHSAGYDESLKAGMESLKWNEIDVPGEAMMQDIPIKHDQPFLYNRDIIIPSDYKDKTVKIRFEGVYSYSRVWVNGNFIRDHSGGFTAWECDITPYVKAGEKASLFVEVTDKADEISYASGYAKHQIGGILRNVSLLALPANYPENIEITTDFDDQFKDADLIVKGITVKNSKGCKVELQLYDIMDSRIRLIASSAVIDGNIFEIKNKVASPLKWDAEHPNLYRLKIRFSDNGKESWSKDYMIGFREIRVDGNKFLVNGREVKFRGACRHDIHPMLGRLSTPEYDLRDVLLAKEANINFIRTSHYPPGEKFLEYCDKYGIFVESETAVCFVGSHRTADYYPGSSENSSDFTGRYMSQLKEMVDNNRNHPSVIMWSIGNENTFGTNFIKSYDWVKANDPTRPVIYSYPGQVPDTVTVYDVISMHYPGTTGTMEQYGMKINNFGHNKKPVIFDEWAHVPCYNQETVKEDPNIRDFWGMSLDTMWQNVFEADGGLGGAIWGMIDETFMLPLDLPGYNEWWGKLDKNVIPSNFAGHTVGYGEWGIIDTWRRKKPEFWSVKKAYSPVRVLKTDNYDFKQNQAIEVPVYNRFDFTNLNEILLTVSDDNKSFNVSLPGIAPHAKGTILFKLPEATFNGNLKLEFKDKNGNLIDYYELSGRKEMKASFNEHVAGNIELVSSSDEYQVRCENNLIFHIDKTTGLFSSYENNSGKISFTGPFINIRTTGQKINNSSSVSDKMLNEWKLNLIKAEKAGDTINVSVSGMYSDKIKADFKIVINPEGEFTVKYLAAVLPAGFVREAGIKFIFGNVFDSLYWKRESYWKGYPSGYLSSAEGSVPLFISENKAYRTEPEKEWIYDKQSFFYNGTENEKDDQLVNVARATKENIYDYILNIRSGGKVHVFGKGDKSCRITKNDKEITLLVNDIVDYPDISWGNYSRNIILDREFAGSTTISLKMK